MSTGGSAVAPDIAVSIRNAYKEYGGGWTLNGKQEPTKVLKGLNLTVATGTIYGLLGSSGCGKSTILKAIVGQHRLTSGEVRVLGSVPGSPDAEIPGPALGYMPQELGLYEEFNIHETLWYFGRIAGLTDPVIKEQTEHVMKLLDLPTHGAPVGALSGGQQRRVSFAVALLHRPALLILDEPTVGVDPILRQSIWDHLLNMVRTARTTVIITTHYIEEARSADAIGLMRHGVLLAQASPDDLLLRFQCDNLEDVLLTLSRQQERQEALLGHEGESIAFVTAPPTEHLFHVTSKIESLSTGSTFSSRFSALLWRNMTWLYRNKWVVAMLIILALLESFGFCLCIGHNPTDLKLSIVNDETNCTDPSLHHWSGQCGANRSLVSCIFLDVLGKKEVILVTEPNLEKARYEVKMGRSWGVLHISSNFSASLYDRIENGKDTSAASLENSVITSNMDMTNLMFSYMLRTKMIEAVVDFVMDLFSDCKYPRQAADLPITFEDPVYGERDPEFIDFAAPGMIGSLVFMLAANAAMCSLLPEKRNSILERQLVTGVRLMEILYSHYIVQTFMMLVQITVVFTVMFGVFHLTAVGSVWSCAALMIILGLSGMWFGFLTALHSPTEFAASLFGMACCFFFMFLGSVMWPLEAIHYLLKPLSTVLPLTYPVHALRLIMARGWGLEALQVQLGFGITAAWVVFFCVLTHISIKLKKV